MKSQLTIIFIISFVILTIFGSCFKEPIETDVPVYSSINDIVYPPDTFKIVYYFNTYIDYKARVIFDTSAVWKIQKINAFSAQFWAERNLNEDSVNSIIIYDSVYVGLDKEIFYNFYANNNSYPESRNFFVRFEKSPFNYEYFTPKL